MTYKLTDNIAENVSAGSSAIIVQRDNTIIDGAGHTIQGAQAPDTTGIKLDGISNVTIKNMETTAFGYGIFLDHSSNNILIGNHITANNYVGIEFEYSSNNNSVSGNDITANSLAGIEDDSSSNNNIMSGNNITANNNAGLSLYSSNNNSVGGNNITNNLNGIYLGSSNNNILIGNNITANNYYGICLSFSSNNIIAGNNITANNYGIDVESSSGNSIYHNNFVNNSAGTVYSYNSANAWNDQYPSGGNYWSDYAGVDLYSSIYQNVAGSDGIGDTQYVIDGNNRDNYPLMNPYPLKLYPLKPQPWAAHDIGIINVVTSKNVVFQGFTAFTNVLIFNYGNGTETVNVTIFANQAVLGEVDNVSVASGNFALAAFTWNTTGFAYGNYTISAYAWPVPGETDKSDNNFTGGWVFISTVGDLTGPTGVPDGKVDIRDIAIVAKHFGQTDP